jgi:hypothetical protein
LPELITSLSRSLSLSASARKADPSRNNLPSTSVRSERLGTERRFARHTHQGQFRNSIAKLPIQSVPGLPSLALTLSPIAQQLAGTLCAAVDAAAEAEAYARGKGLSIQFTADDIRAIGLSIYIGVTRQQGVR